MSKISASRVLLKVGRRPRCRVIEVYLTRGTKQAYIGIDLPSPTTKVGCEQKIRKMTDEAKVHLAEALLAEWIPGLKGTIDSANEELREAQKDLQVLLWVIGG